MRLYQVDTSTEDWSYFLPTEGYLEYYTICPGCRWPLQFTDKLKDLEWQGGGDPGDIVAALAGTFAKRSAAESIRRKFPDLQLLATTIVNRADQTTAAGSRSRRAYRGEDIDELRATIRVPLRASRCTLKGPGVFVSCPVCHRTVGDLDGVQEKPDFMRSGIGSLPEPRKSGKGVFLYEDELAGHSFFFLGGFLKLFCTEDVKKYFEERAFTNALLLEVGETVKRGQAVPIEF